METGEIMDTSKFENDYKLKAQLNQALSDNILELNDNVD